MTKRTPFSAELVCTSELRTSKVLHSTRYLIALKLIWITTCCLTLDVVAAQLYPTKPIRIIVAAAPGGANDILGRIFASHMTESMGQPIVIDNRGGLGGAVGAEIAARSQADGYTLLYCTNALVVNPSLLPKIGYQLRDFAPISLVATLPIVVTIQPSLPIKTIPELVTYSKQRNGLTYGSSGIGSINHLTGALFSQLSGVNNRHVPFKGAGPQMTAILSAEVDVGITTVVAAIPHVRSGRLRALAVTSLTPVTSLPGVPAMASYYPGFNTNFWHGFLAPARTSDSIISLLNKEIVAALATEKMRKALSDGGAEAVGTSPLQFSNTIKADFEKYAMLIKTSGAKPD